MSRKSAKKKRGGEVQRSEPASARREWPLGLLAAAAAFALYLPVFSAGFLDYDDPDYVTENMVVQHGLSWRGMIWAFGTHAANWHPLTWLSHMLDCQLFGLDATAHHVVNVLFHALNTFLVFRVLKQMTGARWRSAAVAAFFAVHPLHVESVAWISERKDVLSAFFGLLALYAYGRYVEVGRWEMGDGGGKSEIRDPKSETSPNSKSRKRVPEGSGHFSRFTDHPLFWYFLALFLFALGLMSKPMLVTLPFVLLLLDFWPPGRGTSVECRVTGGERGVTRDGWRVTGGGESRGTSGEGRVARSKAPIGRLLFFPLVFEKIPFFVLSGVVSVVTFLSQSHSHAVEAVSYLPVSARVANALVSYVRYIQKTLWPEGLAVFYPRVSAWAGWQIAGAALCLAAITFAAIRFVRVRPYLAVGWFWFLGTLVPVIGLVQVGAQSMADRYTYLPSIGLFIMLCWGAADLFSRWSSKVLPLAFLATAALLACAGVTLAQLRYWQNSETLFSHALAVTTDNPVAHHGLGGAFARQGRIEEAIVEESEALRLQPDFVHPHGDLAKLLADQGKPTEAEEHYLAALGHDPTNPRLHNNFGNLLARQGRLDEALTHCSAAVQAQPDSPESHFNLANVLFLQTNYSASITSYLAALQLKPDYAEARQNLGFTYEKAGNYKEAEAQYAEVIRLRPDFAAVYNRLAAVQAGQGRYEDAIRTAEEGLRLATAAGQTRLAEQLAQSLQQYRIDHGRGHEPPK